MASTHSSELHKTTMQLSMTDSSDESQSSHSMGCAITKRISSTIQPVGPQPLITSKLANKLPPSSHPKSPFKKMESNLTVARDLGDDDSVNSLLAKLSKQQVLLEKQKQALATESSSQSDTPQDSESAGTCPVQKYDSSSSVSAPVTRASDIYSPGQSSPETGRVDAAEMLRLKQELKAAKARMARMDEELSQSRITKHTLDQALGSPSEADFQLDRSEVTEQTISNLQSALNASTRPAPNRQGNWQPQEDARSDNSGMAPVNYHWTATNGAANRYPSAPPYQQQQYGPNNPWNPVDVRSSDNARPGQDGPPYTFPIPQQPYGAEHTRMGGMPRWSDRQMSMPEQATYPMDLGSRRGYNPPSRPGSAYSNVSRNGWNVHPYPHLHSSTGSVGYTPPVTPFSYQPTHGSVAPGLYPPQPIGTRLSPTAAEFNVGTFAPTPWNSQPSVEPSTTYVAPIEPINYRKLLDRNMSCNWKYIVDKIVCNNDQQASIFLQQKLKVGTTEQKFEIVEAIIAQAYPLMINRFGNFLIQRCFEHGTPEQVVSIANAIRGNTLNLSMDAFGCHVIQKAFDAVPEEYKAIMVHELLRRIPETVIHRYACHVWQKLFELRWSDSPPQIMKYVNEALRGMWHEVALGETGSLVVQNIFENCLEEDKRPCVNEVLASIDIIAHGQFGNWCIQHICEHGAPADRSRAIDHILRYATEYSMDQYASKVIEKCLKIGGNDFLDRYLERVCEGRPDRPRMPLIDIAGDQFGNYLIQYILTHANPQHRELVATHVRKHMVSLRGSKYGSRVAMLCCNPAFATRPGPPVCLQTGRFSGGNNTGRGIYGGAYR